MMIWLAFLGAVGCGFLFTPVAARAAERFGVLDQPDGNLKVQKKATPYFGGLAVFGAFLIPYSLVQNFDQRELGVLLASTLILLVGLIDDFGALSPLAKMGGQILASFILIRAGVQIQFEFLPPWANLALTIVWLVGITNALNLVDILDGLATSTALAVLLPFCLIAWKTGQDALLLFALCLGGALLGFLPHNWRPAKIYLGDTGSLFIGFTLASLTMVGDYSRINQAAVLVPVFLLLPVIFETTYVVVLRVVNGKNPFFGSPDHLPLRLKKAGFSVPSVCLIFSLLTLLGGILAFRCLNLSSRETIWQLGGLIALWLLLGGVLLRVNMDVAKNLDKE